MKFKVFTILLIITSLSIIASCSDSEVITSYEEVKEMAEPVPITFSPYVSTVSNGDATTRADFQYLSFYHPSSGSKWMFKNIPFLGESRHYDKSTDPDANGLNVGLKIGHAAYNNYIVGVYGFLHEGSTWESDTTINPETGKAPIDDMQADFMTNQPLLHLWDQNATAKTPPYWTYSPLKYWPNNREKNGDNDTTGWNSDNQEDCVTFISYYPFQDYPENKDKNADVNDLLNAGFYRDGGEGPNGEVYESTTYRIPWTGVSNPVRDGSDTKADDGINYRTFKPDYITRPNADLRCIVPPAKGLKGDAAYTFHFEQKPKVEDHIDFMIGINKNEKKRSIGEAGVTLKLRHTLCAIFFITSFNPTKNTDNKTLTQLPSNVEWKVNRVKITNLRDIGNVKPVVDENSDNITFDWQLESHRTYYEVFNDERVYPKYKGTINSAGNDFDKDEDNTATGMNVYDYSVKGDPNYNGLGYKWIILVPPQRLNDEVGKETYVVVDYDLSYSYSGNGIQEPKTVIYKHCKDSIQLTKDPGKLLGSAGKSFSINLNFYLNGINMDAEMKDWDYDDASTYPDDDAPHEYDTYFESQVEPTDVTLNKTTMTLDVGETETLMATVIPSNAYNKVSWSSSDTNVATVDSNGVVRAVGTGTATITVTTYGNKTATCSVTVN